MSFSHTKGREPILLYTDRLVLRMADPDSDVDCDKVLRTYNDEHGGQGGNSQVGMSTIADIRRKHELHGPKPKYCTLAPPPYGLFFLLFLRDRDHGEGIGEGDYVGFIGMSFRHEMPYPDIGYGLLARHGGHGYAAEAGRQILDFWRDRIGVREIFAVALEDNQKSIRCSERIGLVRGGTFTVVFGKPPNETTHQAVGLVLPGMKWEEGMTIRPTIGA